MADPRQPPQPPAPEVPGATRALAVVALFLLVTSVLLPWWGVRYEVVGVEGSRVEGVRLFAEHAFTWRVMTVATGLLVAAAALLLFVRIAARSAAYEPTTYRRHVALAAILAAAALASTAFWPDEYPTFWGGLEYGTTNGTTGEEGPPYFRETALPLLGWWTAFAAALCLAAGIVVDRRRRARAAGTEPGLDQARRPGVDGDAREPATEK